MYLPHVSSNAVCRRLDMKVPLVVFGGLFFVAVAICGTLEAHPPVVATQDSVIHNENVVGPADINLVSNCRQKKQSQSFAAIASRQCSGGSVSGSTVSSSSTEIH